MSIASNNSEVRVILTAIAKAGGTPLFIGGCVRDQYFGVTSKDIDVEVHGLDYHKLVEVLAQHGRVDVVGKSFGIIKLTTKHNDYDFNLPRRDSKVASGHTGFDISIDHGLTPAEAALRRDFTMNAVAEDVDGKLVDPYGGLRDIKARTLRATSKQFAEDPLRVLRGFQFAGRFDMKVAEETAVLCRKIKQEYSSLSQERVRMEWVKWAVKSTKPSAGLQFLLDTGWLFLYPELGDLAGLEQEPEYHPEGCVLSHTMLVCDEAARIATRDDLNDYDRMVLVLAALCHDLGKANTTTIVDGKIASPRHAQTSVPLTKTFLQSIGFVGDDNKTVQEVCALVREHMSHLGGAVNERAVRRLSNRVSPSSIVQLVRIMEADHSGRHPLPKQCPAAAEEILRISQRLDVSDGKPAPILMGRHLIQLGFKPGSSFSPTLKAAYQLQLDGELTSLESAQEWTIGFMGQKS